VRYLLDHVDGGVNGLGPLLPQTEGEDSIAFAADVATHRYITVLQPRNEGALLLTCSSSQLLGEPTT